MDNIPCDCSQWSYNGCRISENIFCFLIGYHLQVAGFPFTVCNFCEDGDILGRRKPLASTPLCSGVFLRYYCIHYFFSIDEFFHCFFVIDEFYHFFTVEEQSLVSSHFVYRESFSLKTSCSPDKKKITVRSSHCSSRRFLSVYLWTLHRWRWTQTAGRLNTRGTKRTRLWVLMTMPLWKSSALSSSISRASGLLSHKTHSNLFIGGVHLSSYPIIASSFTFSLISVPASQF